MDYIYILILVIQAFSLVFAMFLSEIMCQSSTRKFGRRFQNKIRNRHNQLRRKEVRDVKREGEIGIERMNKLRTSERLVDFAKQWTSRCIWQHSTDEMRGAITGFDHVGENLFTWFGFNGTDKEIADYITESWYNEKEFYDFETMTCDEGQVCGHYTQVVWGDTKYIGCAVSFCSSLVINESVTFENAYLASCNYGPAGNWIGERPYNKGKTCSASGCTCRRRLCI